jgi:hypothetical protein
MQITLQFLITLQFFPNTNLFQHRLKQSSPILAMDMGYQNSPHRILMPYMLTLFYYKDIDKIFQTKLIFINKLTSREKFPI